MSSVMADTFGPSKMWGPFSYTGSISHRLTGGNAKILSRASIPCQLVSLTVTTVDPATVVNLYEGTNRSGTLIASITCSKLMTFPFNFRLTGGLYVSVEGGSAIVSVVADAAGPNSATLTMSGNELTDTTRAANADGDALGITVVTNQLINGGFETNTTGWGGATSATISRETQISKFGRCSLQVVTPGVANNEGAKSANIAAVKGQVWSASVWVKGPSAATAQLVLSERDSGGTQLATTTQAVTFDGTWQRVKIDGYTLTNASTALLSITVNTASSTQAITFYLDGAQMETSLVSHGYVATDGAVAQKAFQTPDSSYGAWEAATNLFRRGQCDATTDWNGAGGGTITKATDASMPGIFSTQSIKLTAGGDAANQGIYAVSATAQAAAAGTFGCGSVWFKGVTGASYKTEMIWNNTDASQTNGTATTFVATGDWQLLTPAALAVAVGKTGDQLGILTFINGTRAETFWAASAMLQSGTAIISPYVSTTGGATATRAASQITVPNTTKSFPSTGFWVAGRFRVHWDDTSAQGFLSAHNLRFFEIFIDSNNKISLVYARGSTLVQAFANVGGVSTGANSSYTPAVNDVVTLCAYWGDRHAVSVNGSVFTRTVAGQTLPAWTDAAPAVIGGSSNGGSSILAAQGEVLWFASGTGTLSDADAATINSFGSTDKLPADFPGGCTLLWPADTSRYYTP